MPKAQSEFYECFCCEKNFTQEQSLAAGVTAEWSVEYCSLECQNEFTDLCKARAAIAQATGLVDSNGDMIRAKSNTSNVLNLLEQYKIKATP